MTNPKQVLTASSSTTCLYHERPWMKNGPNMMREDSKIRLCRLSPVVFVVE